VSARREDEQTARLREFTARAARRLDYLEWLILAGAVGAATAGGALIALLLSDVADFPFRLTWIVASVLLFVVPGGLALRRVKKEEREWRKRLENQSEEQEPDV